jgi:hypothetical protein
MADTLPKLNFFKRAFVLLTVGVLVGLLGANPVADAAGIDTDRRDTALRVLCGFALGLATISVAMLVGHFGSLVIAALRQSQRRPDRTMALTLVICGAVCLLMAMAFEWYVVSSTQVIRPAVAGGPGGSATIQFPSLTGSGDQKATISVGGSGEIQIGRTASFVSHALAISSFAAGAVLIALGVWSSMSTRPEGYAVDSRVSPTPVNLSAAG